MAVSGEYEVVILLRRLVFGCLLALFPLGLQAGGGGQNVLLVVNQNSTNSVQLGNYYQELRNVPPQNYLRINWPGTNTVWQLSDFTNTLLNPLLAMWSSRQLTNQIDYVLLSMDIPYRITTPANGFNSTTAALYYGFIADSRDPGTCPLADGSSNAYAGSELPFRLSAPGNSGSNSFLAVMITGSNLAQAKQVVTQGVLGDSSFPLQTVWLGKSSDADRNVRYYEFDNTVFDAAIRGGLSVVRTNVEGPYTTNLFGYENGSYYFSVQTNAFVPGAMADNLTSYGGMLFEDNSGQTTILSFLADGATGSYGTVYEPCNYQQKFPDSQNYFYQSRGFSLAECYYQSLTNPYEGLIVGEPLCAPFAHPGTGSWTALTNNSVIAGTTNLSLQFTASDAQHPLLQVDLFVDGLWVQTVTNIPPTQGNIVSIVVNGHTANYLVPAGATIASVAAGLTTTLNNAPFLSQSKMPAFQHGDRIEFQSADPTKLGAQISLSGGSSGSAGHITTFATANRSTFLDTSALGLNTWDIFGTPSATNFLTLTVTKTNQAQVTVSVTNTSNTDLNGFTQQFMNAINATPGLQTADGLTAIDLTAGVDPGSGKPVTQFDLYAQSPGYAASLISAVITGSTNLSFVQAGTNTLQANATDLVPRNHAYITAGVTNLSVTFPFNTTSLADGYHQLLAVAYEGTHVRTQTKTIQNVLVKNTPLTAAFACVYGGTNTALEATLQFSVAASTNDISTIQLFTTGGLIATVANQSTNLFSVAAASLGLGLHPFYAVVNESNGRRYQTPTIYIRLIGADSPFPVRIAGPPVNLAWPATAGRTYQILGSTNLAAGFTPLATVTPVNSLGQWSDTNQALPQLYYRVSVSP